MAQHNEFGQRGEEIACRYLTHQDYHLLDRNWRAGHFEIDIIADYYGELVFIEVKARSREGAHTALEAVDEIKKRNLIAAAQAYIYSHHLDMPYRFDIITVIGTAEPYDVTHYVNAYTARQVISRHRMARYHS